MLKRWKKHKYRVTKHFYLRGHSGAWEIAKKKKSNNEGGYRIGTTYYDYTGEGLKLAPITHLLLKKNLIKER